MAPPTWLVAALILFVGFAAYSNSFEGIFVFDDEPAIAQNPSLRSLWPLAATLSAPRDTTLAGRPVASLTFALDYAFSGGSLLGFHATNLAIHLIAALLVFGITHRTLLVPSLRDEFGSAAPGLAGIVALLFVAHPLQTGSVTYLVQRVESLMGLFYLATLYGAIRALDAMGRSRGVWMTVAIFFCALGMGTKEVMVTAPLMVMLWDRQFAPARPPGRRFFYAGLAATWIILAILAADGPRASSVGFSFADWPWWRYLMTQAQVLVHYLRLAIYPTPLVLDYEWPPAGSVAEVSWPGLLVLALLAATVRGLAKKSPPAFAGAWCFLILTPTSSVLPIVTEVAAEHRMYLPLAGLMALLVVGLFTTGRRVAGMPAFTGMHSLRFGGLIATAAAVILLARMTYDRNAFYQDYDRIWSDTIARRPDNARARNNYATSLLAKGRFAEAEPHLRVAVERKPNYAEAEANLGVSLSARGKLDEGAVHLQRAILLRPDYAAAYRNLGETRALQHRMAEAVAQYTKALEYLPDEVNLLNRAAWILATAGDPRARDGVRARTFAERAVALTRRQDADSLDSLGAALAESGEFEAALSVAREGIEVARFKGAAELLKDLQTRAGLYARREKFREP